MSNLAVAGSNLPRLLLNVAATAIAYCIAARLSLLLAIPLSEATAVWPPAGIAVAAILLLGNSASIGVLLGALVAYGLSWLDTGSAARLLSSGALTLCLSVGPTLQGLLIATLVRRTESRSPMLVAEGAILRFLFAYAPLGCLVASSLCVGVLLLFGVVTPADFFLSWFTWWIGDVIGVITVAPLLLVLLQKTGGRVPSRRLSVGVPMLLLLAAVILLFYNNQKRELEQAQREFNASASRLQMDLEAELEQSLDAVYALKHYMEGSEYISAVEFERFGHNMLLRNPHLQALEWIPRVTAAQRGEFEVDPEGPGKITYRDAQGRLQPAQPGEEYYPIKYVVPLAGNEAAYGFDVSSSPVARQAQLRARQAPEAIATQPLRLVQGSADQNGLVIYLATYPRGQFSGFMATVLRLDAFIQALAQRTFTFPHSLYLEIIDVTAAPVPVYISDGRAAAGADLLALEREVQFSGRRWKVTYYPGAASINPQLHWGSLWLLLGGMMFTALFGGWLLSLTGRTLQVTREVERRTLELRQEVAERSLVQKELRKLSLAVEHSPSMVLITDPQGLVEYLNPKFAEVSGYLPEELLGQNAGCLYLDEYGQDFYADLIRQVRVDGEWKGEVHSQKKSGERYWAQLSLAPIFDDDGDLRHIVSVHQDITESKFIQEQISYQASHDLLTGLANRYEFERQLQRLLDSRKVDRRTHAYCFCDLDQFKVVNDTSGHAAGDALLKQVAVILQNTLRKRDTLARLGGDEFGILMENCSLAEAELVAHKVLAELEQFRFVWEGSLHSLGVSIGVVLIDDNCNDITDILKNADSACYTAKDAGRNRVHVYKADDELLAKREGEIYWVGEINTALEEDRFELYGQLIVPILDASLKPSIEVLVRLRRDGELINPGAFLPAAERYGLSPKIDRWVVRKAFAWLAEYRGFGEVVDALAINLSGHSLGDSKLLDAIYAELQRGKIDPSWIKFEITETSAIANLAEARKFIDAVKQLGCGLSLDDFGSGLSSFAYLKNLAVDYLKIDGMFVKDIADDPIDLAMVKSINEIGQVMGKKTIAEFVENEEVLDVLRQLGVDYAQGYGIGVPKPLAHVVQEVVDQAHQRKAQLSSVV
ncbi:EAL domain-containing protein [Pseudomaricurvus alcaniphilus]|uniref:EAL domain-containing protein n=1 Tax=Pseudomaricurvus alcaniphilus TaxID=1166482 RepID=UPI0014087BF2|nr:EAL domain-containing protein [Pseudomaricurvus alcaniphilus]NHN39658.1 EAL domain-containing protein [Pseudomaricurvus alcaniphilus]